MALLLLLTGLHAAGARALEGDPRLSGKNSRGETVLVRPASSQDDAPKRNYNLPGNRDFYLIRIYADDQARTPAATYQDQRCIISTSSTGKPRRFSCDLEGRSPLSGVVYKIVRNKRLTDCSYEYKYICIRGCNEDAPRIMKLWDPTCGI